MRCSSPSSVKFSSLSPHFRSTSERCLCVQTEKKLNKYMKNMLKQSKATEKKNVEQFLVRAQRIFFFYLMHFFFFFNRMPVHLNIDNDSNRSRRWVCVWLFGFQVNGMKFLSSLDENVHIASHLTVYVFAVCISHCNSNCAYTLYVFFLCLFSHVWLSPSHDAGDNNERKKNSSQFMQPQC